MWTLKKSYSSAIFFIKYIALRHSFLEICKVILSKKNSIIKQHVYSYYCLKYFNIFLNKLSNYLCISNKKLRCTILLVVNRDY